MNETPKSTSMNSSTKRRRQRRNLLVSVFAVVIISLGSFSAVVASKWTPRLGLDLAGGLSVVYQTQHHVSASQLAETVDILNNRVNGLGVSGAQVNTTGNNEITVSIPGLKNPAGRAPCHREDGEALFPSGALLRTCVLSQRAQPFGRRQGRCPLRARPPTNW